MLSHAQNLEDVIFQRVFDRDWGFYIDVGANDPVVDSTTYALYLRGWRGIAVEPQAALHERALLVRPDDVNLAVLASDQDGAVPFWEVETWHGLSTLDPALASRLAGEGFSVRRTEKPALRLDTIIARHGQGRHIDILAVDAEGAEPRVLAGLDLSRHRPTLVMIEAMAPMRQVDVSAPAAAILAQAGYACVYEDGLNRFFLAAEAADLRPRFRYPPNVFDDYRRRADIELEAARARIAELEAELARRSPERPGEPPASLTPPAHALSLSPSSVGSRRT